MLRGYSPEVFFFFSFLSPSGDGLQSGAGLGLQGGRVASQLWESRGRRQRERNW